MQSYHNDEVRQGQFSFSLLNTDMDGFRDYLEGQEEQADIQHTLAKIPERHRRFLQGFSIHFQGTNTLNNDGEHVGVIQTHPKPHIIVAAPWKYPREWVLLHEVAHLVYEHLMDEHKRSQWAHIVHQTQHKQDQSPEELFCMGYANVYATHKIRIHDHPQWDAFIKTIN
jgi:hypothetical protein